MKDNMKIEMEAHKNQQLERIVKHMDNMARLSNDTVQELTLQNIRLQSELDKTIKQLKDYEKALKDYADGDFYEAFVNFKHNKFDSLDIIDKKGNVIYTKAQETLKKWKNK